MSLVGFFDAGSVRLALAVSAAAACVCAPVGVLAVLRGQSFASHALADIAAAGGAAALLLGVSPGVGFLALSLAGAFALAALEGRGRGLATGIVLGGGLGLTALLLFLDQTRAHIGGAAGGVMFGSLFALAPSALVMGGAGALLVLAAFGLAGRGLVFASLSPELARVAGLRVRGLGALYLVLLALSVTLGAMSLGAVLATVLLIGPALAALRLTRRPVRAVLLAGALALAACWGGIALAWASYGWWPGHVWPVSFFITFLVLGEYGAARAGRRARHV
ncbi:metal ABC transporter permease [Acidocella sp.]|uniref:metal ABC transporter permease n=1 Tax=Acidocella sp. TaxID=50710 RepID=UPI002632F3F8|nr:metal ABC transporter permease [Acidocella sp.]